MVCLAASRPRAWRQPLRQVTDRPRHSGLERSPPAPGSCTEADFETGAARIHARGWSEAYAIFKHEDDGTAAWGY
jgi:hypothetical protein